MMRVVALVSGGKDSCHSMLWCRVEGHSVVALAHLRPASGAEMDSMMYQSAGHEAVHLLAQALGLPLFQGETAGRALSQGRSYSATHGDEVEDLLSLLSRVQAAHPEVEAVCSGAILSDYQRVRVEGVCQRLGLRSLAWLWRRDQAGLLREMRGCGMVALLVKVASFGLSRRHLGRQLGEVTEELIAMRDSHQLNPCGEGGEFESFVLDSPLFLRPLRLVGSEEVVHSDDAFAPVAYLRLRLALGAEKGRGEEVGGLRPQDVEALAADAPAVIGQLLEAADSATTAEEAAAPRFLTLSADGETAGAAVAALVERLHARGLSPDHVAFTWLLLPDLSLYAAANAAYAAHFPAQSPPCRAAVQTAVPRPRAAALLLPASPPPRHAFLHVQSQSHWAPANIGPYSQAVALPGAWTLISGTVGLRPADLAVPPARLQPLLGLRHATLVADAVPGPQMHRLAAGVCYGVDDEVLATARRCFHENVCPHANACRCQRWVFARVSALPKNTAVEWQPFLCTHGGRVRRFAHVDEAVWEDETATWVVCTADVAEKVEERASDTVVVIPVDGLLDGHAVCVVNMY